MQYSAGIFPSFTPLVPKRETEVQIRKDQDSFRRSVTMVLKGDELMNFAIPNGTFLPDHWTETLIHGLSHVNTNGKKVLEIGVGSGIASAYLLATQTPSAIYGSDIRSSNTVLAQENIRRNLPKRNAARFHPCHGNLDLANWVRKKDLFEIVFGCLPKLATTRKKDSPPLNASTHYDRDTYRSEFNNIGLGLHDNALSQIYDILPPGGEAVFIFDGCYGEEAINILFQKHKFKPDLLLEEIHEVHPETDMHSYRFAEENNAHRFEYFADRHARQCISASEAATRLAGRQPVFHHLSVMKGTKI